MYVNINEKYDFILACAILFTDATDLPPPPPSKRRRTTSRDHR